MCYSTPAVTDGRSGGHDECPTGGSLGSRGSRGSPGHRGCGDDVVPVTWAWGGSSDRSGIALGPESWSFHWRNDQTLRTHNAGGAKPDLGIAE